ncbi:hypothetical protein F5876DRAFT_63053 [Lentinula aff. lateritia]|uniref:Uncharacterized protein n=1 Tax=Lentinula aff. lateritia TaxID=2804960 RepID=A0ACC1UA28_9AGAR|nr:hypothetical protein F5876DRAFT_63053 [Lentinula aff. lateritia]
MPNSNGETWTWVSLKSPPHLFGEEALALCIGPRNCFAVWPTTKEALLPLSAFRVNVPTYPGGQIDHSKLITLNGKANFKSQTYPNYAHLPERSTISKLLENVDELTKQTGVPITGDISYLSASLALLKNEGDLGDPDKTEKDWAPYKKKVEQDRSNNVSCLCIFVESARCMTGSPWPVLSFAQFNEKRFEKLRGCKQGAKVFFTRECHTKKVNNLG